MDHSSYTHQCSHVKTMCGHPNVEASKWYSPLSSEEFYSHIWYNFLCFLTKDQPPHWSIYLPGRVANIFFIYPPLLTRVLIGKKMWGNNSYLILKFLFKHLC